MTPRELLRRATAELRSADVPDPEVDSALLLSFVTGQPPMNLRLDSWTQLSPADEAAFLALCDQRKTRVPLQYLTHRQSFLGRDFYVDDRVLIPRPETELLAEQAIAVMRETGAETALDLCCGSGCLGVSLSLACPLAQVHAADLSPDALAVTRRNAESLCAALTLHQGDLFAALPADFRFGVIVSNPPYIPTAECRVLQAEVMQEPAMALDGGADGLDLYRRIAAEAPARLTKGGTLLMEVGAGQARDVMALCVSAGMTAVAIHEDYQHIERFVEVRSETP